MVAGNRRKHDELEAFVSNRDSLIALATKLVGQLDIAEDLVQDTWLRWCAKEYSARDAKPILRRIVSNLAYDWHRRQKIERDYFPDVTLHSDLTTDSESVVIAQDQLARVTREILKMHKSMRAALLLHRVDGLTYVQIAKRLSVAPSTAHKLVEDALVRLVVALSL